MRSWNTIFSSSGSDRYVMKGQQGFITPSLAEKSWWLWPWEGGGWPFFPIFNHPVARPMRTPILHDDDFQTEFLSTYGIMASTTVHPLRPESDATELKMVDYHDIAPSALEREKLLSRSTVNASFYLKAMAVTPKPVVYVIGTALASFKESVLPFISKPFVLVTGSAIAPMPGASFNNESDFKSFIEDKRIRHWFAQNGDANHPKFTQLPVGLDYHTLYLRVGPGESFRWGGHATPQEQENQLKEIRSSAKAWKDRKPRIFACFNVAPGRDEVKAGIRDARIIDWADPHLTRQEFWQKASEYQFVLSPPGYGWDAHRTWEALVLGAIPIVGSNPLERLWESNRLPVYVMKDWSELQYWTEDTARATGAGVKSSNLDNPPSLKLKYWQELFQNSF